MTATAPLEPPHDTFDAGASVPEVVDRATAKTYLASVSFFARLTILGGAALNLGTIPALVFLTRRIVNGPIGEWVVDVTIDNPESADELTFVAALLIACVLTAKAFFERVIPRLRSPYVLSARAHQRNREDKVIDANLGHRQQEWLRRRPAAIGQALARARR